MGKLQRRLIAGVLSLALLFSVGLIPTQSAAAAKKPKLNKTKATITVGKTVKLKVKNKTKAVKWSSKNKKIATVNKKGLVKGKKKGTTKIIARTGGRKLTCKVTVKAKKASDDEDIVEPTQTAGVDPVVEPTPGPTDAGEGIPTVAPTDPPVPTNPPSNLGTARTVEIVGGTSTSMVVRDNGSMRPELSSQELIAAEMGLGINLGDTMEATKPLAVKDQFTEATDFEQAENAPITTQEYIDAVHSYGFNTLRIPVAWSSMVSNDGEYTINAKMLGRVEEIANYALNNGMYVIINEYHDYGWWGQFGSPDENMRENAWKRYESYWTQISNRFKDYSDHLLFESADEELGSGLNVAINEDGYPDNVFGEEGTLSEDEWYETANQINQLFVDTVRASGGNNLRRHLLVAGVDADIDSTVDSRFEMPKDEENGVTKLSVSVHYYEPWAFCGDEDAGATYTEEDYQNHITQFDKMKSFTEAGYGIIISEFGVYTPKQEGVYKWFSDVLDITTNRNCLPVLWDSPGLYFDRGTNKMTFRDIARLYNSLTGASGDTDIEENTSAPSAEAELIDKPSDTNLVWLWVGTWKKNDGNNIDLNGNDVIDDPNVSADNFVRTSGCTDGNKIVFNEWGYQAFLTMDWAGMKKPCLYFTFEEDAPAVVGKLSLGGVAKPNDENLRGVEIYNPSVWSGRGVVLSEAMKDVLEEEGCLQVTFSNAPMVTGIYLYDLGK